MADSVIIFKFSAKVIDLYRNIAIMKNNFSLAMKCSMSYLFDSVIH